LKEVWFAKKKEKTALNVINMKMNYIHEDSISWDIKIVANAIIASLIPA
jgi:hypothetical protein